MMALAAATIGLASAQFATWRAPPLDILPTHATILTGTVHSVEALPEGRRITLEPAQLDDAPPLSRWLRVRLRANDQADVAAGDTIRVRALVRPPAPPAYPGAWDLQRDAWFNGHGGSGYALGPVERLAETAPSGPQQLVQQLRELIARRITAVVPGPSGAISVTLLTGVTSGIPPADHDAFRGSGLAHLLAVAGLHIGIVMGWVLVFSRLAFAASEHASLHWPTKKLAALTALTAGGGYLVLTGMHMPIVRSFAMACLYTVAVLAGRRAISLRGLALAATVLMLLEPEEVPSVSFQMSFSAVLALISGYELLRPALRSVRGDGTWTRRFALHLAALALTSFLAGTASAPFGAYHFGRIQVYFVVANMVRCREYGRRSADGALGDAGRAHRPRAHAVRTRLAGIHPDGLERAGDPLGRAHNSSTAGRDVGRPAYAAMGAGDDRARHRMARAVAQPDAADRRAGDCARFALANAGAAT